MFKSTSTNSQNRVSAIRLRDIPGVPAHFDNLAPEDQKDVLIRALESRKKACEALEASRPFTYGKNDRKTLNDRKAFIGMEIQELQAALSKVRTERKKLYERVHCEDLTKWYIAAAKEVCGALVHEKILKRAAQLLEDYRKSVGVQ